MIAGSCILALVCCKLFGHPDLLVAFIFLGSILDCYL